MADQVNPMGSLAPGLLPTLLAASRPQPVQEKPRAAKPAESQPGHGLDGDRADQTAESIDLAAKVFQTFLEQAQSDLSFQVDQSNGRFYFKLIDAKTKEVIRQVPSDEILAMARKLRELSGSTGAPGVLVDKEG